MSQSENQDGISPVDEILADYMRRADRGEAVDREALIEQHSEVADELRAYFADADAVDDMVESESRSLDLQPSVSPPPSSPGVIRYVGDYEILTEIGRGGMGVVYKACQRSLKRTVAVKLILPHCLVQADSVVRFRREAETAAALRHPNIVSIHEVGEHKGQHYYSMDYIEGRNLAELSRDGPLSPRKAAKYMLKAARAIAYAHGRGTLHRDLKPSNIIIDSSDEPQVTDFGLARQLGQDSSLTGDDERLGSPSYMAPEQAMGRRPEIGPLTDVYALGATLYAITTGSPPFQAATREATRLEVIHSQPVPPSKVNPAIDRELEAICMKCLEKDPRARYATAKKSRKIWTVT